MPQAQESERSEIVARALEAAGCEVLVSPTPEGRVERLRAFAPSHVVIPEGEGEPLLRAREASEAAPTAELLLAMRNAGASAALLETLLGAEYPEFLAAYDRLPNGYFFDKICENRTKLEKVRAQLGDKLDAGTFRSHAAAGMRQLNGEFNTSEPSAVSKTYLLLRGAEMKELADRSPLGFGSVQEFYIDEKMGGIQKLDNAPMKLLRLTLLDCTETSLLDLIQEI